MQRLHTEVMLAVRARSDQPDDQAQKRLHSVWAPVAL